jgi:hypothetical protein
MRCVSCRKEKVILRQRECRRCCTVRCNGAALERIVEEFKSTSRYNREIFDIYVALLKTRFIKNSALPVARAFARILSKKEIPRLDDWATVERLSIELGLKYRGAATHGCPVIIVGRELQSRGKILPRNHGRVRSIKNIHRQLRAENLLFFEKFSSENLQGKSGSLVVRHARAILGLQKTMRSRSILLASEKDLARHFKPFDGSGIGKIEDERRILKRIFAWAKSQKLVDRNPVTAELAMLQSCFCPVCEKTRIFRLSDDLCNGCYVNARYKMKVAVIERESLFKHKYNGHLFALYLIYIRRFKIKLAHVRATRLLSSYLQIENVDPILTWVDVKSVAGAFTKSCSIEKFKGGSPIEKIGYMLQELGVIGYRDENHDVHLQSLLAKQGESLARLLGLYSESMIRSRRTPRSAHMTVYTLILFNLWMSTEFGAAGFLTVNQQMICRYLEIHPSAERFGILHKFYRWLKFKKLILVDPFDGLNTFHRAKSLEILSDDMVQRLHRFIRATNSNSEYALMLALVLFWGLTAESLAYAQIALANDLTINLYQKPLSYRRKRPGRAKQLLLPQEPRWLNELQKRFLIGWQGRLEKLPNGFGLRPLIMGKQLRSARPLRPLAVQKRFYEATQAACGMKIPMSIVRRTGAHLFTRKLGEASILREFGWSADYSFDFLWMPRKLFTETKSE